MSNRKKKTKKQFMIEKFCYLRINDRKFKIDYIKSKRIFDTTISHNQITNEWRIIVNENHVWFIQNMTTLKKRNRATLKTTKKHKFWKISIHKKYKKKCVIYYRSKIQWKFDILLQICEFNYDWMIWSFDLSIEIIVIMTKSTFRSNNDYRKIMKQKKQFNEKMLIRMIKNIKKKNYDHRNIHDVIKTFVHKNQKNSSNIDHC